MLCRMGLGLTSDLLPIRHLTRPFLSAGLVFARGAAYRPPLTIVSRRPPPDIPQGKDEVPRNPRPLPAMTTEEVSAHFVNRSLSFACTDAFTLKVSPWPRCAVVRDKKTYEILIGPRVAYVNSKKSVDNRAVYRNRARRRLDRAAKAILPLYAQPRYDYVFFLREPCITQHMDVLKNNILLALKRVHCLRLPVK
ncbi:hypothetical protein BJ684DRAFT_20278 [Piptocephalis cylindrospora]|uniref:Uncharacterized protein n=1 Tax=Piptocephalis cylindrospora TaxID=1907219 RepID=A0A4P9Y2X1_9FUNG|nr:hypothetical protein BJ684DRAFT_20278 [Piptocephalis cylindrospora]|eukprot:RKP13217.1 hypothetical protein BJ684DRAFT_20278 [Piptocephalis cylindrospora]